MFYTVLEFIVFSYVIGYLATLVILLTQYKSFKKACFAELKAKGIDIKYPNAMVITTMNISAFIWPYVIYKATKNT